MKRRLQALAVILLLGIIKMPVEERVTQQLRADHLLTPMLDFGLRDNLSQMSFAASLGGLRSLVASITYLQAYEAWSNVDWGRVDSLFRLTTSLQPRYDRYWDDAAWHMAYNAASYYQNNKDLNPAVKEKLYNDHVQRGVDILREGLHILPDSPLLWKTLGEVLERRLTVKDPKGAADCYMEVYRITKNFHFARLAGYQYAETRDPALWQKGYYLLKESYDKKQRTPSVINTLKDLENKLNIPMWKRIPEGFVPTELQRGASGPRSP